eukprot:1409745-Karenia_brevis.AAC.1
MELLENGLPTCYTSVIKFVLRVESRDLTFSSRFASTTKITAIHDCPTSEHILRTQIELTML